MSVRTVQSNALAERRIAVNQPATIVEPAPWTRNPSWLALPSVGDTEQKFVGLCAVWPESNFLALSAAGNYTVNWGDGLTENFATGVTALHEYDFTDTDIANTNAPVTFQDTGDTVTRTAHGYTDGMTISFNSITTTTGITAGQIYYVVNAAADTFQVSATNGGAALPLTNNGSGIILPYKQVIVTVTPQAGQNLTNLNLNLKHTSLGTNVPVTGWLDILVSGPNLTSLTIQGSSAVVNHYYLEQAQLISTNSISSFVGAFSNCINLQSVPIWTFRTTATVDCQSMFGGCTSLTTVPLFNTVVVTNMQAMFNGCTSLTVVPLFNTVAVTNMTGMFTNCESLTVVPLFNTVAVINMSGMFSGCVSLTTVPLFNTALVQNMSTMFNGCTSLKTVPLFNTGAVTNMQSMFNTCTSLKTVPLFNTSSVQAMTSMFSGAGNLKSIPLFNTPSLTSTFSMFVGTDLEEVPLFNTASVSTMSSMFSSCARLQTVPLFNTASVQNMQSMFSGCSSLQSVPELVTSAVTTGNFNLMFSGTGNLSRIQAKNFNFSFSVGNSKLSKTAIEEIFTNLPRVTTTQTITVGSGLNYGAPAVVSLTGGTTSGSTTVTMASTTGLAVGMEITGAGITDAVAVTMQDTGDTVTRANHGIPNGTPVSFATIVTTTGIITFTTYYVVNSATNTFQVALTVGGAPLPLTTNGSGTLLFRNTITAITPNTNITLSVPASATASVTTSSALLQRSIARLKNWTVA